MKKHFLNTIFGAWLKVFLSILLGQVLFFWWTDKNLFNWGLTIWQQIFSAAIAGTIPVIINYLNPHDPRYGNKKKSIILPKEVLQNKNKIIGGTENGFVGPVPMPTPPPPPPPHYNNIFDNTKP